MSQDDLHYFPQEPHFDITFSINRDAFVALQERVLYEYVESGIQKVNRFVFQTEEGSEFDMSECERERSILVKFYNDY